MSSQQTLADQVNERKKEFKTDSYPMSIGEIINLYRDKEIKINPDYQRFFRWTIAQKSRFIESILLGIPIPPIFVYQDSAGKWEVVDGVQRISTILEFRGLLINEEDGSYFPPSTLQGTKILPKLDGITWETLPSEPLQLVFKRTSIKIEIIKYESNPQAKFEVFQRLNSGGSLLTSQEFRNCLLIMLNKDFYSWIEKLALDEHFQNCISLSDKLILEKYDMELVLRFFLFPQYKFSQQDISEYLTDSAQDLAIKALENNFPYDVLENKFKDTFKLLDELLGEDIFKKYSDGRFKGKFLESLYEAISIGVSENINLYNTVASKETLRQKIQEIWQEDEFVNNMGSGSNTKIRVPKIVPFGIKYFS